MAPISKAFIDELANQETNETPVEYESEYWNATPDNPWVIKYPLDKLIDHKDDPDM